MRKEEQRISLSPYQKNYLRRSDSTPLSSRQSTSIVIDLEGGLQAEEAKTPSRPAPTLLFQSVSANESVWQITNNEVNLDSTASPQGLVRRKSTLDSSPSATISPPEGRSKPAPNSISPGSQKEIKVEEVSSTTPVKTNPLQFISLDDDDDVREMDVEEIEDPTEVQTNNGGAQKGDWVKKLNRKRPAVTQAPTDLEITPPKRIKRTPSYDLISGQPATAMSPIAAMKFSTPKQDRAAVAASTSSRTPQQPPKSKSPSIFPKSTQAAFPLQNWLVTLLVSQVRRKSAQRR